MASDAYSNTNSKSSRPQTGKIFHHKSGVKSQFIKDFHKAFRIPSSGHMPSDLLNIQDDQIFIKPNTNS